MHSAPKVGGPGGAFARAANKSGQPTHRKEPRLDETKRVPQGTLAWDPEYAEYLRWLADMISRDQASNS
jgi:hypothetical protein